jgi:hypothetical protein
VVTRATYLTSYLHHYDYADSILSQVPPITTPDYFL